MWWDDDCRVAMHVYYICPWRVRGNTRGEARGTVAVLFPGCITAVFVDRRVYVSITLFKKIKKYKNALTGIISPL